MSGYFDEQIAQGKPIVPPTAEQAPSINQAQIPQGQESTLQDDLNRELTPVEKAQAEVERAKLALEEAQKDQYNQTKEWVGLPVRGTGDRIFLLIGGKRHWITNPQAYEKLGFKFGDEAKIDEATLKVIPEGEPIRP